MGDPNHLVHQWLLYKNVGPCFQILPFFFSGETGNSDFDVEIPFINVGNFLKICML